MARGKDPATLKKDTRRYFTLTQKKEILYRQDNKCAICHKQLDPRVTYFHHEKPWALGGITEVVNGQALCPHCHEISSHKQRLSQVDEKRKSRSTTGELKLSGSKKSEITERKSKEALENRKNEIEHAEKEIEAATWYGKGFAIRAGCGLDVDVEFHQLIGLLIGVFNDITFRLDPEKLNDEFVGYLRGQLETLRDSAQRFWETQEIRKDDAEKEKKALMIIQNFRPQLFKFERCMEPYLKKTEAQKAAEGYYQNKTIK